LGQRGILVNLCSIFRGLGMNQLLPSLRGIMRKMGIIAMFLTSGLRVFAVDIPAKVFSVDQFSGQNDREKINEALLQLSTISGPKKLIFQPREYIIEGPASSETIAVLHGHKLHDLVIEGQGAVLVAKNMLDETQGYFFKLEQFKNLSIRDLHLTYRPKPFIQGTLTRVDQANNQVQMQLDSGFDNWQAIQTPTRNSKLWCRVGQVENPRLPKAHSPSWLEAEFAPAELQENITTGSLLVYAGKFDLSQTLNGVYNWAQGDPIVIWKRGAQDGFYFENGENLLLQNILVDSALHYSIKLRGIIEAKVLACSIEPASGAYFSACADGIDIQQSKNIVVEDCKVLSNGDDGISLLNHAYHGYNGEFLESKLSSPYPETNENIILFRNHLQGGNRNGMLVLASNVLIQDNIVEDTRQYGLKFCGDDTSIIGNTFRNMASFSAFRHIEDELNTGVICSDEWLQKKATIKSNLIDGWYNMPGLLLKAIDDVEVADNFFDIGDDTRITVKPFNPSLEANKAMVTMNGLFSGKNNSCHDVRFKDNLIVPNQYWRFSNDAVLFQPSDSVPAMENHKLLEQFLVSVFEL
jgi:parallel beta-helix repeat protein